MKQIINDNILANKNILYVEDDDDIRDSTLITLKLFKMNVSSAKNGQEGLVMFKKFGEFDVVLTDIKMPKIGGLSMIEEIKMLDSSVPAVVTTAYKELNFLQKSIELGVSSYVIKPIDIYNLKSALEKAIEPNVLRKLLVRKNKELKYLNTELEKKVRKRTKELEASNKKLELLATVDYLTNIPNRRHIFEIGNKLLSLSQREQNPFSVLMFDIDFFKKINDTYGHQVGDKVLRYISSLISSTLRESDFLGRVGGEEFFVLLNKIDINGAKIIAEKIRLKIENMPYNYNNKLVPITISVGVSTLNEENNTLKKMYKKADDALYEAKRSSRNCVCCIE